MVVTMKKIELYGKKTELFLCENEYYHCYIDGFHYATIKSLTDITIHKTDNKNRLWTMLALKELQVILSLLSSSDDELWMQYESPELRALSIMYMERKGTSPLSIEDIEGMVNDFLMENEEVTVFEDIYNACYQLSMFWYNDRVSLIENTVLSQSLTDIENELITALFLSHGKKRGVELITYWSKNPLLASVLSNGDMSKNRSHSIGDDVEHQNIEYVLEMLITYKNI